MTILTLKFMVGLFIGFVIAAAVDLIATIYRNNKKKF
jgi:hypothetical protein